MRVYFSTVVRGAPVRQAGECVWLDWESKDVRARQTVYPTNPELDDPNPRGNTRGGRGIAVIGDNVITCLYHTLRLYDRDLNYRRDLSHSLMVGLHEVYYSGAGSRLWVTATAIDALLEVDIASGQITQQVWPREMPGLKRAFGLTPLAIDKEADNRGLFLSREHLEHPHHLHLNAVAAWQGEKYALFNAYGAIVNLDRDEVVLIDPALRGGHNLIIQENGTTFVNDTLGRAVRVYDLKTRAIQRTIDLTAFDWVRRLSNVAPAPMKWARYLARWPRLANPARRVLAKLGWLPSTPGWSLFVRGLDQIGDLLFVGLSPASILCIDWRRSRLVEAYNYSRDTNASVHGLKVLPD